MDGRMQAASSDSLLGIAGRHLRNNQSLIGLENSHLRRDASLEFANSRQPLQDLKPDLSQLSSQMQFLEPAELRLSGPAIQPDVPKPLLQSCFPATSSPDLAGANSKRAPPPEFRDWEWNDDRSGAYHDHHGREVRRVTPRRDGSLRFPHNADQKVPSCPSHIRFVLSIQDVGYYISFILYEIWQDPIDSDSFIIARRTFSRRQRDLYINAIEQISQDVIGDPRAESFILHHMPHSVGEQIFECQSEDDSDGEDILKLDISELMNDPAQENLTLADRSAKLQFQSLQGTLADGIVGVDLGSSNLKSERRSCNTELTYMTYTISEDRSGDAGTVVRQLLSALAIQRAVLIPNLEEDILGKRPFFETSVEWNWFNSELTAYLRLPREHEDARIRYKRPILFGDTSFPELLVCAGALKQLGYSYQRVDDGTVSVPLALAVSHVEEIVVLSMCFNGVKPHEKNVMDVQVNYTDAFGPVDSYAKGETAISSLAVHTKALVDRGMSFRQSDDCEKIIIDQPLSAVELEEVYLLSETIRNHETNYSLATI